MTARAVTDPHVNAQRRILTVLALTQVIGTIGVGVAPSIGVLLAGQVTDDEAWAGLARTSSTLGAALLGLPLGALAARRGRRVALTSGWWIAALGAALLVVAAQGGLVVPLFAGLLLIGAGSAVSLQARFAATDLAAPQHRARSLALVVWVGTAGMVLGPNLGVPGVWLGAVTGLDVFAAAFLIAAACLALAGLLVLILLRPDPLMLARHDERTTPAEAAPAPDAAAEDAVAPAAHGRMRRAAAALRGNPTARLAVLAILTAQVVMVAIMTMTPVHLVHHGGSVTVVGLTISLHIAGMYALAPLVGIVADRLGHRAAIGIGTGVLALSLLVGALRPDALGGIALSLALLGVGWSFVNVSGSALFSGAVPLRSRASAQGGVDALSNLCGAVAAFASGPLLAASSFSVLAVIGLVALVPLAAATLRAGRPRSAAAPLIS